MSASKKKHLSSQENKAKMEMSDSDTDNTDTDSGEDESGMAEKQENEEILVDFEGRNPIDSDYHGIKQLLQQLFLKAHINLSEMSETIIGQNYIGSVIIQGEVDEEDDEDDDMAESNLIFGITSALNITNKKDLKCIDELKTYILEKAKAHAKDDVLTQFKGALEDEDKSVGFLINERFINIPAQISIPLLENLYKEVKRATAKKMNYDFAYYLMLIKFYRKESKKKKQLEDIYSNPEEEVFDQQAVASFEYSVELEADTGVADNWAESNSSLIPYRKVVLFDANKLPDIILSIKHFIKEEME